MPTMNSEGDKTNVPQFYNISVDFANKTPKVQQKDQALKSAWR